MIVLGQAGGIMYECSLLGQAEGVVGAALWPPLCPPPDRVTPTNDVMWEGPALSV